MLKLPSRFRRLDEILADLPVDEPMLLTELDGYLTAVVVCPAPMAPALWLPPIWGGAYGETPPFDDPIDATLFGDMVVARQSEIERDFARGRPKPIYDVERNGDIVWEDWIGGFAMAMDLAPEGWASSDEAVADAFVQMRTLIDVAFDRSDLTSAEINAVSDEAPVMLARLLMTLYGGRARPEAASAPGKIGRNDPCSCGSGKKHKRCCGAS
ncbi:UPF0149 family protein [Sphingomonas sp. BIUV-7]|uniref:UPF0149 family protein n=1 Tax=Sphingomonas natans TaxID=3063330 RepID=A0ABT8YA09_9SPHN|nr:UPF0149 family protein [Sphingomonas sp. BIUV-7]